MTFFLREIFAVESFIELLFGSLPDFHHLAGEIENLSSHRMVEIHRDGVLLHLVHGSLHHLAGVAEHRNHLADDQQFLADPAVDLECGLRKIEQPAWVESAVAFFRAEGECEFVIRLLAFQFALELRKKHMRSVDVLERTLQGRLVGKFSVHNQFVGQFDHLVLFYFHQYEFV